MPELPEVETARTFVESALKGKSIQSVWTQADPIMYSTASHLKVRRALKGRKVEAVARKGKQMWLELENGPHVAFHLGMTGSFQVRDDLGPRLRFTKLEIKFGNDTWLAFLNKRRLGRIRLHQNARNEPPVCNLGWDPMEDCPTPAEFYAQLQKRKTPIKALLLNQQFIAGIGNWIADEILYQAGVHPAVKANKLSRSETDTIRRCMLNIIRHAIIVKADAEQFPKSWLFHHRWGKDSAACTAGGEKVEFIEVGGRTTAYVPSRQLYRPK